MKIRVENFKRIKMAEIELAPVNIFIGTNNSGKSSFIQAIQFAVSTCQTLELQGVKWRLASHKVTAIDSSDFLFTPTKDIANLYHNGRLSGTRNQTDSKEIKVQFFEGTAISEVRISKGKNRGLSTYLGGMEIGEKLCSLEKPYCVYVPGIAGIPIEERFEVPIVIQKSATSGNSNSYLRNILRSILADPTKKIRFHTSVQAIYPSISIESEFDGKRSEFIDVWVLNQDLRLPIDSVGTGLLQAIQIFAYLEYFDPEILLLDEPDSHIHPTKQIALANELAKRATMENGPKVVFSTHSRYILEALEGHSMVAHFNAGQISTNVAGSKILLDIGAADADYLFSKQQLKYIIATEDTVDNTAEKKQLLKHFLIANGLDENEFVLHSYGGCTKVDFAKILEGFVRKHIPTAKVLIHYDRDQKQMTENVILNLIRDCQSKDVLLFITEVSEVENYYCRAEHIAAVYDLNPIEVAAYSEALETFYDQLKDQTIDKIKNFILNHRPDRMKRDDSHLSDISKLNSVSEEIYQAEQKELTPGKELLGKVKGYVQQTLRRDPNLLLRSSPGLISEKLQGLLNPSLS